LIDSKLQVGILWINPLKVKIHYTTFLVAFP